MSTLIIREATVDDAPEIGRINVQTWQTTYAGLIEQAVLDTLSTDKRREFWSKVISEHRAHNLILVCEARENEESSVIYGYISGGLSRISGFDAEVFALYCDAAVQSRGAGSALLHAFLNFARSQSWNTVCVRVLSTNPYKRFYYKHGAVFAHHVTERINNKDYQEEVAVWTIGTMPRS